MTVKENFENHEDINKKIKNDLDFLKIMTWINFGLIIFIILIITVKILPLYIEDFATQSRPTV